MAKNLVFKFNRLLKNVENRFHQKMYKLRNREGGYSVVAIVDTWLEYNLLSLELPTSAETRERLRC